jgi:hypothetical protein
MSCSMYGGGLQIGLILPTHLKMLIRLSIYITSSKFARQKY